MHPCQHVLLDTVCLLFNVYVFCTSPQHSLSVSLYFHATAPLVSICVSCKLVCRGEVMSSIPSSSAFPSRRCLSKCTKQQPQGRNVLCAMVKFSDTSLRSTMWASEQGNKAWPNLGPYVFQCMCSFVPRRFRFSEACVQQCAVPTELHIMRKQHDQRLTVVLTGPHLPVS